MDTFLSLLVNAGPKILDGVSVAVLGKLINGAQTRRRLTKHVTGHASTILTADHASVRCAKSC
jgi:hypothetical protein